MLPHLAARARIALLPGKPPFGFAHAAAYDATYRFWLEYWRFIRREVGLASTRIDADGFLRHDLVVSLAVDDAVIGMIACTFLDFARPPAADHSYVNDYFGESFVAKLHDLKLARLATLENIFLDPAWRSAKVGFSLGAVMMAIALRKVGESGCDGVFGAPRSDAPTARICTDLGARTVVSGLAFHGKPTDLVVWRMDDVKAHPSPEVEAFARHLWDRRLDTLPWDAPPASLPSVA